MEAAWFSIEEHGGDAVHITKGFEGEKVIMNVTDTKEDGSEWDLSREGDWNMVQGLIKKLKPLLLIGGPVKSMEVAAAELRMQDRTSQPAAGFVMMDQLKHFERLAVLYEDRCP